MSTEPKIVLMDETNTQPLRKWRATETVEYGLSVAAGELVADTRYKIVTAGDTDFTLIGATSNAVGTIFTATEAGIGTGTAIEMLTKYNVKSGESSDVLKFMIWNNRKSNAVIDLELTSGCTVSGDVAIELDKVSYTVTVDINTDTDLVAENIKTVLDLDEDFAAAWTCSIIPEIIFDGLVVRNTILTFKAIDYAVKGDFKFTANATGVAATMKELLVGNDGSEVVSKITDAKIFIRDDLGGIASDVVKDKWAYIKNDADVSYTNIGADTDPDTQATTQRSLDLKAISSSAAIGEILGSVNTGILADDTNYDKLSMYMTPPAVGVAQGIRPWKLVITYNFT